jgi:hypothetical protein
MIRVELANTFDGNDAILVGAVPNLKTALKDGRLHGDGMHWEKLILAVNRGWAFLVSKPMSDGSRITLGVLGQGTGSTRTTEWNRQHHGRLKS